MSRAPASHIFTYTAHKSSYLSIVCTFLFICLIESILLILLIITFIPDIFLRIVILGYTSFAVLGSALDANLTIVVEGWMQTLMQEEMPLTPRRLQLLALTVALFSAMLWLVWKLPLQLALPALALLDVAILFLLWPLSQFYLARLLH
ncbi:MAG: hypothetical protein ACRDHZ_20415 [Ktedonobacteraceae bacterium]